MELYYHRLLQEQSNFLTAKRMTWNFLTVQFADGDEIWTHNTSYSGKLLDDGLARVSEYGLAAVGRKQFNTSLKVK